jgi:probable HAF family extracellular repeat protein
MRTQRAFLFVLAVAAMFVLSAGLAIAKGGKKPKPPPEPPPGGDGPTYTLIDLGGLGGHSVAAAINQSGQVAGSTSVADGTSFPYVITPEDSDGDGKPDRWYRDDDGDGLNDLMITLGQLGGTPSWTRAAAFAINDHGQVVGYSTVDGVPVGQDNAHGFFWAQGEMTDLGVFAVGEASYAVAINIHGQVVGQRYSLGTRKGSFLILPADTNGDGEPDCWFKDDDVDGVNDLMTDLGRKFWAKDINDAGVVVGKHKNHASGLSYLLVPEDTDGDGTPDLWYRDDDGDGLSDLLVQLPFLASAPPNDAGPEAVNASGQAAGSSPTGGKWNVHHAVRWESDRTPTDLGTASRRAHCKGLALNDGGDVVGHSDGTGLLWKDGKMHKFLDLLTDSEGIDLIMPRDINNSGYIVGHTQTGGHNAAFIAVPAGN